MESINDFLNMKSDDKAGILAFLSKTIKQIKENTANIVTIIVAGEVHPKFCPNEGMHNKKLKNKTIKIKPYLSKYLFSFIIMSFFLFVRKHNVKNIIDITTIFYHIISII